jgi:hypothetical protein
MLVMRQKRWQDALWELRVCRPYRFQARERSAEVGGGDKGEIHMVRVSAERISLHRHPCLCNYWPARRVVPLWDANGEIGQGPKMATFRRYPDTGKALFTYGSIWMTPGPPDETRRVRFTSYIRSDGGTLRSTQASLP